MRAHSAFGRNAGLSLEEIRRLRKLELDEFEDREYVALKWVRDFLTRPDGVPEDVEERFASAFAPSEQLYVKTAMKCMFCINLLMNAIQRSKYGVRLLSILEKPLARVTGAGKSASRKKALAASRPA